MGNTQNHYPMHETYGTRGLFRGGIKICTIKKVGEVLWQNKHHAKVCSAMVQSMNGFLRITAIVAHDSEKDIAERTA